MTRPRYAFLFSLNPGDYTAWANGLKQAGYATNPNYAPILIKLIEDYRLYQLDSVLPEVIAMNTVADRDHQLPNKIPEAVGPATKVFHRNRIDFVVAKPGDNISKLTKELDLLRWEIRKYNEIPKKRDIQPGQVVYLQPKRRQAEPGYSLHTVAKGETMYSISQLYGVKLSWLYKRNHMKKGTQPKVGQEIWLRGMKPGKKR
jgi:LysM repeat protein